jgi:hypothetical protein
MLCASTASEVRSQVVAELAQALTRRGGSHGARRAPAAASGRRLSVPAERRAGRPRRSPGGAGGQDLVDLPRPDPGWRSLRSRRGQGRRWRSGRRSRGRAAEPGGRHRGVPGRWSGRDPLPAAALRSTSLPCTDVEPLGGDPLARIRSAAASSRSTTGGPNRRLRPRQGRPHPCRPELLGAGGQVSDQRRGTGDAGQTPSPAIPGGPPCAGRVGGRSGDGLGGRRGACRLTRPVRPVPPFAGCPLTWLPTESISPRGQVDAERGRLQHAASSVVAWAVGPATRGVTGRRPGVQVPADAVEHHHVPDLRPASTVLGR